MAGYGGRVELLPDHITPAGIRQEYPIHHKSKHLAWDWKSVKGLTYIVTDRGRWLKTIGRKEDDRCDCGSVQNAAHLVGGGEGRTEEQCWDDQEWCRAVADFLA